MTRRARLMWGPSLTRRPSPSDSNDRSLSHSVLECDAALGDTGVASRSREYPACTYNDDDSDATLLGN